MSRKMQAAWLMQDYLVDRAFVDAPSHSEEHTTTESSNKAVMLVQERAYRLYLCNYRVCVCMGDILDTKHTGRKHGVGRADPRYHIDRS